MVYLRLVCFVLGTRNLLIILISLEVLSWVFIFLIEFKEQFKYLVVQAVFLLSSLVFVLIKLEYIILLRFLLKLGLPPLHLWVLSLLNNLKWQTLAFMFTFHKFLSLIALSYLVNIGMFMVFLLLVLARMFIVKQTTLLLVLVYSSIVHSNWILIRLAVGTWFFVIYWSAYSILRWAVFQKVNPKFYPDSGNQPSVGIALIILSGMPPFMVFFLKLGMVVQFILVRLFLGILALISAILGLIAYLKSGILLIRVKTDKSKTNVLPFIYTIRLFVALFY